MTPEVVYVYKIPVSASAAMPGQIIADLSSAGCHIQSLSVIAWPAMTYGSKQFPANWLSECGRRTEIVSWPDIFSPADFGPPWLG